MTTETLVMRDRIDRLFRSYAVRLVIDPENLAGALEWSPVRAESMGEAAEDYMNWRCYLGELGAVVTSGALCVEVVDLSFPHETYRFRMERTVWRAREWVDDRGQMYCRVDGEVVRP